MSLRRDLTRLLNAFADRDCPVCFVPYLERGDDHVSCVAALEALSEKTQKEMLGIIGAIERRAKGLIPTQCTGCGRENGPEQWQQAATEAEIQTIVDLASGVGQTG